MALIPLLFLPFLVAVGDAPPPPGTEGDPHLGKRLFVSKGCVSCHAIRGVGGKAAPPLDVLQESQAPTEMEFVAGLWRGAPIMLELQRLEIGYQIDLSARDLKHLAAFAASVEAQDSFTLDDVPPVMRDLFLDQIYFDEAAPFGDQLKEDRWPR